jgi:hypothetical protein
VVIDLVATDAGGATWWFDVSGAFTSRRSGLQRTDLVWRTLGRAAAVRAARGGVPLVLLATELPRAGTDGDVALRAAGRDAFFDAVAMTSADDVRRLARYGAGGLTLQPAPGFWR